MSFKKQAVFLLLAGVLAVGPAAAGTPALFALIGTFKQETIYAYTVEATPQGHAPLSITVPLPQGWQQPGHLEEILSLSVEGEPEPTTSRDRTDRWGNVWRTLRWTRPAGEVQVVRRVRVETTTDYGPIFTSSPYPVARQGLPWEVSTWLWQTVWVQSNRPEVKKLAASLVAGARTELEAVVRIINWVRANVEYACSKDLCEPVPRVDALFTLQNLKGNCINFSNLAMALLRAAGIPARPAVGFVADREESCAAHAWVSVYFPDLGWMDFESANWMPAYREVPTTFLLPQHITLYHGEGEGVSKGEFTEAHNARFTVLSRPEPRTALAAEVRPGQAVSWVVTVRNDGTEERTYNLLLEGVPDGWHAATSESMIAIDPNGVSTTWDTLLTVVPPEGASPGAEARIRLVCLSEGVKVGEITASVRVTEAG